MSNEDLPSINDIVEENNLPSYKDFIEEKELPSVEDYITESPKEEILVEEIENINPALVETAPEWAELVRLVNDLRKEIPEIPEIKYYDEELSDLSSKLTHIEEYFTQFDQKSNKIDDLDVKNEHFEEKLTEIESKIPEIPTIRYYDHDIEHINDKITQLKEDISSLPEIKHYDSDISSLIEELNKVKSRDVPDFRWIGNTFNTIDEDFTRVQGHLDVIKEKISFEVSELNETIQVKNFEQNINVKNLKDNVSEKIDQTNTRLTETKDKIYSELSKSSLKVWEYHREFKDDDRKLKKAVLSEQNKIKQKLEKEITSINEQSIKTDETLLKFFNELKEQVNLLPEVKYYDNDISTIVKDIDSLKSTVRELKDIALLIKKDQKQLQENYLLNEPPSEKEKASGQTDTLTPLDQKFATLDDLSNHYRLFINRITTQLSTMGGGGAGFIKDLDDVDFSGITTGSLLIYEASTSKWVGIASTALGGGGGDADSASKIVLDVRNKNVGYALTIGTPVYQVGYNSGQDRLNVEIASADTPSTMPAKGVVSTTLENNTNGQIIVYGELEGVNTSAFEVADELYVAPGGGLTNVRPTDPTHLVQKIAVVLKKSTANGAILVYGAGRTNDVPNNISIAGSITAVDGFFSGNVTVGGTITYEDVKNIDSIGIITARTGVDVLAGGINVTGVSTINTGIGTVHIGVGNTTLLVQGDARVTGILTIGTGSITLDPNARKITGVDEIIIGTATTVRIHQDTSGEVVFSDRDGKPASVGIGTTVSINTTGIITATSFFGDGSQLTNIISGVGIQSTSTRIGTGYTDINFTGVGVTVVGSGTTITIDVPTATITRQTETITGVTTVFTITGGYDVGKIDVYVNGAKQISGSDYTASNGTTVTMTPFVNNGDVVEFQKIDQLRVAGITSTTNATNAFNLNSQAASHYLDYDNFTNTPTIPTNNNQLTNGAGFITGSSSGVELTGIVTSIVAGDNITISGSTGIVTITSTSSGGGSGISSVGIQSGGVLVGTAQTINFGSGVTITNDVATVSVGSTLRFVGARMYHDDYSVTTSGSWTEVANFDGTSIDTNSFANTTNGRFTIPAGVSKVRISTNIRVAANGNTNNQWSTYKNGSILRVINGGFNIDLDGTSGYNNPGAFGQTAIISVVEGDYFNIRYYVSNTSLDVDLWYQIEVVEGDILGTYFSATNIVDDTSPQLGGNLDINGKNITGIGNVNLTGIVTATTFYGDGSNLTNAGASAAKSAAIASFLGR